MTTSGLATGSYDSSSSSHKGISSFEDEPSPENSSSDSDFSDTGSSSYFFSFLVSFLCFLTFGAFSFSIVLRVLGLPYFVKLLNKVLS